MKIFYNNTIIMKEEFKLDIKHIKSIDDGKEWANCYTEIKKQIKNNQIKISSEIINIINNKNNKLYDGMLYNLIKSDIAKYRKILLEQIIKSEEKHESNKIIKTNKSDNNSSISYTSIKGKNCLELRNTLKELENFYLSIYNKFNTYDISFFNDFIKKAVILGLESKKILTLEKNIIKRTQNLDLYKYYKELELDPMKIYFNGTSKENFQKIYKNQTRHFDKKNQIYLENMLLKAIEFNLEININFLIKKISKKNNNFIYNDFCKENNIEDQIEKKESKFNNYNKEDLLKYLEKNKNNFSNHKIENLELLLESLIKNEIDFGHIFKIENHILIKNSNFNIKKFIENLGLSFEEFYLVGENGKKYNDFIMRQISFFSNRNLLYLEDIYKKSIKFHINDKYIMKIENRILELDPDYDFENKRLDF